MRLLSSLLAGLLLMVIVSTTLPSAVRGMERPSYNVLLVTLDTMRADRLGLYGYQKPTSAVLDSLAAESVVFDLGIAQASITPVSHASILTGLYPYHHHLRVMHGLIENRLLGDQVTLAEVWQAAGGQTAAFVSAYPVTAAFGLDQGFTRFDAKFPQADGRDLISADGIVNTGLSQRRADVTTDAALAWLRAFRPQDKPFFMWIHYFDPHDAFLLPPPHMVDSLMNGVLAPRTRERSDIGRALYDCDVYYMDKQLGRLLSAIKRRGLWGQTIIAVIGDHGEGQGDHGWWSHGLLYQEQIRVPYMVRIPGVSGGRRIAPLVRSIDLMPTILDAAEISSTRWPKMDGQSLLTTARTGQMEDSLVSYSGAITILTYARPDKYRALEEKKDKLYCLMSGRHKFIYHQLCPWESELYDLAADPKEEHNLAGGAPPIMSQMLRDLKSRRALSPLMPGMTPTDLERIRRLGSLGYIN